MPTTTPSPEWRPTANARQLLPGCVDSDDADRLRREVQSLRFVDTDPPAGDRA